MLGEALRGVGLEEARKVEFRSQAFPEVRSRPGSSDPIPAGSDMAGGRGHHKCLLVHFLKPPTFVSQASSPPAEEPSLTPLSLLPTHLPVGWGEA